MFAFRTWARTTPRPLAPATRTTAPADAQSTYYEATSEPLSGAPALTGTRRCDVCIIGAGYTGLSAALHLAARGLDVVVLEADRIGAGASGRNGGFVLPGFAAEIADLIGMVGAADGKRLWALSVAAVRLVEDLVAQHGIDCQLKRGALTAASSRADAAALVHLARQLDGLGYRDAVALTREETRAIVDSPLYFGGLLDHGAAHLHPLRYLHGLARAARTLGAEIFENSRVVGIDRANHVAYTGQGRVAARHLVLAANARLGTLAPDISRRILPVVTFIGATEPLDGMATRLIRKDVAIFDTRPALDYYRLTADHRLLFGGAARLFAPSDRNAAAWLARRIAHVFPQLGSPRIDYVWNGVVDLTRNRLPDVGLAADGIWYAQGFNGHGVALTTFVGRAIADAIAGDDGAFGLLARLPRRGWPGGPVIARAALPLVRSFWQICHALGRPGA
ncbi:MAG TPA: FAD-binding oxidoreductase [Alphaproteobacteria bacterium]